VRGRGRLVIAALVCLGAGLALTFPFEAWYTLLPGVLLMLAFVVCGVFAIASPDFLARDDDDDAPAG
jgi:hypothetical protein